MTKEITKIEELSLTKSPLTEKQLLHILQGTPAKHKYNRPAKGGGTWEYVTVVYVQKVLNYVFGWRWNFEIVDKGRESDLVWVQGRLTIKDENNNPTIIKEQFGRADVKFKKGTKEPLDYGNDLKAAASDALKKCASLLGIASDIYGKNEFKEIKGVDKGFIEPVEELPREATSEPEPHQEETPKIQELKSMLVGKTEEEKIADLEKRTGLKLINFQTTQAHATRLIATLMASESKNYDKNNK